MSSTKNKSRIPILVKREVAEAKSSPVLGADAKKLVCSSRLDRYRASAIRRVPNTKIEPSEQTRNGKSVAKSREDQFFMSIPAPKAIISLPFDSCDRDEILKRPWLVQPTEQPLSCELRAAVVEDLKAEFWWRRFQTYEAKLSSMWRECQYEYPNIMQLRTRSEPPPFQDDQLEVLCNKAMTVYHLPSIKRDFDYPRLHLACIDNIWLRYFDQKPKMDFGYYIASPVHILETGPSTIAEILTVHATLCERAADILAKPESAPYYAARYSMCIKRFLADGASTHFKVFPLCRALIALVDRLQPRTGPSTVHDVVNTNESAHKETLLLVRTGDESGLSAPIDFECIRHKCLPLEFDDPTDSPTDVIRVTIATAVDFVTGLLLREEAAFPDTKDNTQDISLCQDTAPSFDKAHVCLSADVYAGRIMTAAEESGIDQIWETWRAIRRVKARERGERFMDWGMQPLHLFNNGWILDG